MVAGLSFRNAFRAGFACVLALGGWACSSGGGLVEPPGAVTLHADLAYCADQEPARRLDIYVPPGLTGTAPVALHVHGGGWARGDKATGEWFQMVADALLARGYVVASANYRLAPRNTWPAQIEDVACAVRFLQTEGARYGIDGDRVALWGNSAGGHLAALVATSDAWSGGQVPRVRAVAALWGIFDLTAADMPIVTFFAIHALFGRSVPLDDPALQDASPTFHVSPDDPPFLLVHGREDGVVPANQSEGFKARLDAAGVSVDLQLVANAGHELLPDGGEIDPGEGEIVARIVAFFDEQLGR